MNKVVIIGAGKTGRGFVGRLASEAGCEIVFVDSNKELVDKLNNAGSFEVAYFGDVREKTVVSAYHAATWEDADLSQSELIFVSVGGQNLEAVGEMLKEKLPTDSHHYIITCENASSPAEKLSKVIGRSDVTVSEATVFCTTIDEGEVGIASEDYPYLQCDRDRLGGYVPFIPAVRPVGEFGNFLTRKLYTYNAASCVIAYLGAVKGYEVYSDAANDPQILALLDKNYEQSNRAMCLEFGYTAEDQAEFALLSRKKFTSTAIRDTVYRNARDVARKMAPGERIIGIMNLVLKHGGNAAVLEMTAAAALLYTADPKWEKQKSEMGYESILKDFCGIEDSELVDRIMGYVSAMEQGNLPEIG